MNRNLFLLGFLLPSSLVLAQNNYKNLTFYPQYPQAGQTVEVVYEAASSLAQEKELNCAVFFMGKEDFEKRYNLDLKQEKGKWKVKFEIPKEAQSFALAFHDDEEEKIDTNENGYYLSLLHDTQGKPIAHSYQKLAEIEQKDWFYVGDGRYGKTELAKEFYDKEISLFPQHKRELFSIWIDYQAKTNPEGYKAIIKPELDAFASQKDFSEKELQLLEKYYTELGEEANATKYAEMLKTQYPKGNFAFTERIMAVYQMNDADEQIKTMSQIQQDFKGTKDVMNVDLFLKYPVARKIKEEKFEEAQKVAEMSGRKHLVADYYASIALAMVNKNKTVDKALMLTQEGLKLFEKHYEIESQLSSFSPYQSPKFQQRQHLSKLSILKDAHAFVLAANGKTNEAIKIYEEIFKIEQEFPNREINERYIKVLENAKKFAEVQKQAANFIAKNQSTPQIDAMLKNAYLQEKGSEQGFEEFLAPFKKQALEEVKKEIRASMQTTVAPDFTLTNMEGKTVKLTDLKGKNVVIDFWATWCGPCVKSFPAMQATYTILNGKEAEFLFINTFEDPKDIENKVSKFLASKNYTFNVLLDKEGTVAHSYKVQGIPTKVFIDKNGNIRYVSSGYNGASEEENTTYFRTVIELMNESN